MKVVSAKKHLDVGGTILDIVTVGGIYLIAQFVAGLVLGVGGVRSAQDTGNSPKVMIMAYLTAGIVIATCLYLIIRVYRIKKAFLYVRRVTLGDIGSALLAFVVYIVLTILAGVVLQFIPGVDVDQKQELGLDAASNTLLPLIFLSLVVVPPLVEEFMFRGFLYQRLKFHRMGIVAASILTSVLFGIVHGQVNVAVDTFILSMVMLFVMEKRKNIWVAVIVHALKNALAFLALFVFKAV